MIIELGSQDMIIGKDFFKYNRTLIDVYNQRLRWPQEFPPSKNYSRIIATYTRADIRPRTVQSPYQQDLFRRDRVIARDDKRRRDGVQIRLLIHRLEDALPKPV